MQHKNPLSLDLLTGIFQTSPQDDTRIINREGTSVEFKESYNHGSMAQYFKAMASFANNAGGYIIFGVGNNPRKLIGLQGKSLAQFEELKVEDLTLALLDYFSPEIRWEHCTFEFRSMNFGVIYVYPLLRKPCICKKHYDSQNTKYSLKEGDIYYRYGGRSERIRYTELNSIIDESRSNEEKQWLEFAKKAIRIGVTNAAVLDLKTGHLSGNGGTIVVDSDLLKQIAFIQEGRFVETGGTPTLRLIGDVKEITTGKVVMAGTTKKIVRAIEPSDIIRAFLLGQQVDDPLEYIKRIPSATSANFPIYFFLQQSKHTLTEIIDLVNMITIRGSTKRNLLERLHGKTIPMAKTVSLNTLPAQKKNEYMKQWLDENVPDVIDDISYCIEAIFNLSSLDIQKHSDYIRATLLKIYNNYYEQAVPIVASNIRKAICRVDEALYLDSENSQ